MLEMGSGGIDLSVDREFNKDVLFIGFNQDQSCLAVGLTTGFKIFNCSPFHEQVRARRLTELRAAGGEA